MVELVDYHCRHHKTLEAQKVHFTNRCRSIAELIDPNLDNFIEKQNSHRRQLYSGVPQSAVRSFTNNMSSILMGKYPWFFLQFEDVVVDELVDARTWLDNTKKTIYKVLSSKYSNFNTVAHRVWMDLALWGNAVVQVLPARPNHEDEPVYFLNIPLSECCFEEDSRQVVNKIYRKFSMTAENVMSTFSDIPADIMRDLQEIKKSNNSDKDIEILHCVYPIKKSPQEGVSLSDDDDDVGDNKYYSLYILLTPLGLRSEKYVLEQRKLKYFNYLIVRWNRVYGSPYAQSPAMEAEIDIRTLHIITEALIARTQFELQPVLKSVGTGDGYIQSNVQPGTVIPLRVGQDIMPLELNTQRAFIIGQDFLRYFEERVEQKLYKHLFEPVPNYPEKTATQVRDNRIQNLKQLGPAVERAYTEFLIPVVEVVYKILLDGDMIPEYPEVVAGNVIKVAIQTPITNAQNTIALENLNYFANMLGAFAQMYPDMIDAIDNFGLMKEIIDGTGIPYEVLKTRDEYNKVIEQRRAAQEAALQQQMANEAMQQQGSGIKNIAQAAQAASAARGGGNGSVQ